MNDFSTALELMTVGMFTVFVILFFVVIVGNLIIRVVNKYFPEDTSKKIQSISAINPKKISAIVSAINVFTKGSARVTKIEKM
ncbi:MAG: OadG family protein [Bacteroidota bacterium]|nr:OadG family protein [Bacteroidota bacterium]